MRRTFATGRETRTIGTIPVTESCMRLGILQCDSVRPELQPRFADYPDMFRSLLDDPGSGLDFVVHDLVNGHFPDDVDDCDAWLITGSKCSVNDAEPWIEQAHELVRAIHAARRPLIGICFGHQLIASALGGRVERAEAGWGAGVHVNHILRPQAWMEPAREDLALLVSHQDQVVQPPSGAVVLAGHDFCPFDMLQVEDHILTFQGHPEFEPGYSRALIELRHDRIGPDRAEAALDSLAQPADSGIAAQWIRRFIERAGSGSTATMTGSDRPKENAE